LAGRGSKYYGCDISNPQKTFSRWGFRIICLRDIDFLVSMARRRGFKILCDCDISTLPLKKKLSL
jgi:hypothetical protein